MYELDKTALGSNEIELISHRERSSDVWLHTPSKTIFKTSPKYLIDNEYHFLEALRFSGFVPQPVLRKSLEVIAMPYIERQAVTDPEKFMSFLQPVLEALKLADCRHGDLTEYSVLVHDNKPVIIDFGESRPYFSPLPDKRREGDRYWLTKTMEKLANDS